MIVYIRCHIRQRKEENMAETINLRILDPKEAILEPMGHYHPIVEWEDGTTFLKVQRRPSYANLSHLGFVHPSQHCLKIVWEKDGIEALREDLLSCPFLEILTGNDAVEQIFRLCFPESRTNGAG